MSNEPPIDPNSSEDNTVSIERVLKLLNEGEIQERLGRVRWSSNYTSVITVKDDSLESLAVYKPQRGERPLWDFPDGTLCYREVAAFLISDTLGWDMVAPTVLREGPQGVGSVQLFIEHDPEINYFSLSESFIPQLKLMAAFDVLVNNTDRKGGHCLVDPRGKLWGIDHGICFHASPKLRTVIWDFAGETINNEMLSDIQRVLDDLCAQDELYDALKPLLNRREIAALQTRARQLLQSKKYPFPGPGPNYPWPPV